VWQAYSVIQERSEISMTDGYMVDHTSRVYVIDKAGLLRMTFPFGFDIEKIVQDIDHLLREDEG
jgi:cytochrome oxidase Cu insertion factor (SCO1/SenC/PrrC family)